MDYQYDLKKSNEGSNAGSILTHNKKVLIFALTGDISENALARIMTGHFDKILGSLDFN
jgi:hypothetical protein